MKLLRSVVNLYEDVFKNIRSDVIFQAFNEKERRAFSIIQNYPTLDDSALSNKLANELYGLDSTSNSYKAFKKIFKGKLRDIVSLTISQGSDIQRAEFLLLDEYCAIAKLRFMGLRDTAVTEGKALLTKAIKRQNFTIAKNICRDIVEYYCIFEPKSLHRDKYIKEYEDLSNVCTAEFKSQVIFGDLVYAKIVGKFSLDQKDEFISRLEELDNLMNHDSCTYWYYYYQIQLKFAKGNEYEKFCRKAIEYFSGLWYNHSAYAMIFKNRLIQYLISIKEFARAELNLKAMLKDVKRYSHAWYNHASTLIRVYMKIDRIDLASELYQKLVRSKKYRFLVKEHRNEIELIGMYIALSDNKYKDINIRKLKYNLNWEKKKAAKENVIFLVGEIIYLLKSGNLNIEPQLRHLRKIATREDANTRCLAFCDYLEKGTKYRVSENPGFESEVVDYEKLVLMV